MSVIAKAFLLAFQGNLERQSLDRHGITQCCLEDICSDEPIHYKDLPQAVPQVVRQQLVAKSQQLEKTKREIEAMLADLETTSGRLLEKRERKHEASKHRCKTCGQVTN